MARLGMLMIALLAPALALAQMPDAARITSGSADYKIGPNDVVDVVIVNEPEHNRTVQVGEDGTISLVHLERPVSVEGLTANQVQDKLAELYREYYKHPQVFVTIKEFKSQSIRVFGAVKSPGQHRLTGSTKILDVLSQIGGPAETGGERLVLLRKLPVKPGEPDDNFETIHVDMHSLYATGDTTQNHEVKNGDVLFVPRADEVYVLGEVKNPGAVKFTAGMTVTQAISKVAGFTRIASRRVQVVRVTADGTNLVKKQYDLHVGKIESGKDKDFVLQASDLVVVPESFF